jgi:excinuclease ABC subunit C
MIDNKLKLLPNSPGCYLMKDINGTIIYVGKAKNLKNRVTSYFKSTHTGKTAMLVSNIIDFEYIVTGTETEALLLELNLIKKYDPKFNILMRDDKTYPYIELTNEKYPRLLIVRNHLNKKTKSKLFGPYPNAYAAKKTMNMLNRMYPLRKCQTLPKKECLYYHIGECMGYCTMHINQDDIDNMINDITKFLKGNDDILIKKVENTMYEASNKLNFEKAKEMRELLNDIKATLSTQHIDLNDHIDRDVFGYHVYKGFLAIQVFHIRGGRLVQRDSNIYPVIDDVIEELTYYICSFYDKDNLKPKEIFVPKVIDTSLIESILNLDVISPKIGKKKELVDMANHNAKISLEEKFEMIK